MFCTSVSVIYSLISTIGYQYLNFTDLSKCHSTNEQKINENYTFEHFSQLQLKIGNSNILFRYRRGKVIT